MTSRNRNRTPRPTPTTPPETPETPPTWTLITPTPSPRPKRGDKISGSTPTSWRMDPRRSQNNDSEMIFGIRTWTIENPSNDLSKFLNNLPDSKILLLIGWTDTISGGLKKIRTSDDYRDFTPPETPETPETPKTPEITRGDSNTETGDSNTSDEDSNKDSELIPTEH